MKSLIDEALAQLQPRVPAPVVTWSQPFSRNRGGSVVSQLVPHIKSDSLLSVQFVGESWTNYKQENLPDDFHPLLTNNPNLKSVSVFRIPFKRPTILVGGFYLLSWSPHSVTSTNGGDYNESSFHWKLDNVDYKAELPPTSAELVKDATTLSHIIGTIRSLTLEFDGCEEARALMDTISIAAPNLIALKIISSYPYYNDGTPEHNPVSLAVPPMPLRELSIVLILEGLATHIVAECDRCVRDYLNTDFAQQLTSLEITVTLWESTLLKKDDADPTIFTFPETMEHCHAQGLQFK